MDRGSPPPFPHTGGSGTAAFVPQDTAIRSTDTDAAVSRLSAASLGYLHDPFATHFVKRGIGQLSAPERRPPLINIGTFVRSWAIDRLVQQFLDAESPKQKQIVSLGAGTDTRFWRLCDSTGPGGTGGITPPSNLRRYVEIDFNETCGKKASTIMRKKKDLGRYLSEDGKVQVEQGGTSLLSPHYALIPGDLRQFPVEIAPRLSGPYPFNDGDTESGGSEETLLDPSLPTLFIAECVLIYLDPEVSTSIVNWFSGYFGKNGGCMGIVYEMIAKEDQFSKVMVSNLQSRNIHLLGLPASTSVQSQADRFLTAGFDSASSRSVKEIRQSDIPTTEKERISRLEFLDEIEELDLILEHYCVAWATQNLPPIDRLSF